MILVTGASGLLGFNFIKTARDRFVDVVAVYNSHPISFPMVECVRADLSSKPIIDKLISTYQPNWIVHCAALTNVDWCEEHPRKTWQINAQIPYNLALAARESNANLIYISTDSVFDGLSGDYSELSPTNPPNIYAKSKLIGEELVKKELDRSLVIRTNIYGWGIYEKKNLAEWILGRLKSNQIVPGFTDAVFNPILVNDLSEIILDAIDSELTGLYHIAGKQTCNKYEFAQKIAEIFGLEKELVRPTTIDSSNLRANRPKNTSLSTNKISHTLNRVMPDLASGLKRFKDLQRNIFPIG